MASTTDLQRLFYINALGLTEEEGASLSVSDLENLYAASPGTIGSVKSVDGVAPDENGNITLGIPSSTEIQALQTTLDNYQTGQDATDTGVSSALQTGPQSSAIINSLAVVTDKGTVSPNVALGGLRNGAVIAPDVSGAVLLNPGGQGYNNVIGGDGTGKVNTTTPNTSQTGTAANQSVIGGYDNVAGSLSSKIISDHSYTEVGGGGHNVIIGGNNNVARTAASFAGIFSGSNSEVAGNYAIAMGRNNKARAQSTFVTGNDNDVSGTGSTAVGANHIVAAAYANARGLLHEIPTVASYATADGYRAKITTAFERAYSDGGFGAPGSTQESTFMVRALSTDAANKVLGIAGSANGPVLAFSTAWGYEAMVVGQDTATGDTAAWKITGAIRRGTSGASTQIGAPQITKLGADTGASTWAANAAGSSAGNLSVYVNGEAGKTIRWVATIRVVQVRMPGAV